MTLKKGKNMKKVNKDKLKNRALEAMQNIYHNATPSYPSLDSDYECDLFESWFSDHASYEIQILNDGGAHGGESTKQFVMSKWKSGAAHFMAGRLYVKRRDIEIMRYAPYENITEYGKLYTYGRGGRTLAPENLMTGRGNLNESIIDEMRSSELTRFCIIVESFNKMVGNWNKEVPNMFKEAIEANEWQAEIDARKGKKRKKVTVYV